MTPDLMDWVPAIAIIVIMVIFVVFIWDAPERNSHDRRDRR